MRLNFREQKQNPERQVQCHSGEAYEGFDRHTYLEAADSAIKLSKSIKKDLSGQGDLFKTLS